jgi:hypothetical protein
MSTSAFATTMKNAASRTTPMISGKSWFWIARIVNWPSPGSEKVVSVSTAPPSSRPRSMPKMVRIGVSAARRPCRTTTVRSGRPLALAVLTKSSPMVSSIPARVSRAYRAA